ncbi:MAG: hypothetical protein FJX93_03035 [Bacteroidetes bacterium]|nr:hypothetical protein [Bacteroidota bacterium]
MKSSIILELITIRTFSVLFVISLFSCSSQNSIDISEETQYVNIYSKSQEYSIPISVIKDFFTNEFILRNPDLDINSSDVFTVYENSSLNIYSNIQLSTDLIERTFIASVNCNDWELVETNSKLDFKLVTNVTVSNGGNAVWDDLYLLSFKNYNYKISNLNPRAFNIINDYETRYNGQPEILSISDSSLVLKLDLWENSDADCCPSKYVIVKFNIREDSLVFQNIIETNAFNNIGQFGSFQNIDDEVHRGGISQSKSTPTSLAFNSKGFPVQEPVEKPAEQAPKPSNELSNRLKGFGKPGGTKGGTGSGQGSTTGGGDQGSPNGSGTGNGSGGAGGGNYQLGTRSALERPKLRYDCDGEGVVVVKVYVDRNGVVKRADGQGQKGSTTSEECLIRRAEEAALKTRWQGDPSALELQVGTIRYNFQRT